MAQRDAMYFILPTDHPGGWNTEAFYETGRSEIEWALGVAPPAGARLALDLGCGLGRTLFALASRFDRAVGFDVSREMVARVNESPKRPANAEARLTEGRSLPDTANASADFIYSTIVFQHIPDWADIESYIHEIGRVLAPGGTGVLHFDTRAPSAMRGLYLSLPDPLLPAVHRRGMRRHPRPAARVRDTITAAGLRITGEFNPDSADHRFCLAR